MENLQTETSTAENNNLNSVTPKPSNKVNKFLIITTIFLLVLLLGMVIFLIFLLRNNSGPKGETKLPLTKTKTTITQPVPVAEKVVNTGYKWIYIKDGNIFQFSDAGEDKISTDASKLITYRDPKWINKTEISYIKCVKEIEDGTKPQSCNLIIRTLKGEENIIYKRISVANKNGYQVGDNINFYNWSKNGDLVAFAVDKVDVDSETSTGTIEYHLINVKNKTDRIILSVPTASGRGGWFDDNEEFVFSEDNNKIIIIDTALTMSLDVPDTKSRGTFFVYDIIDNKLLYENSSAISSFGSWLDNISVIMKQTILLYGYSDTNLVTYNLSTKETVQLASSISGANYRVFNNNTLMYTLFNPAMSQGVVLHTIKIDSKEDKELRYNYIFLKKLSIDEIAVKTLSRCVSKLTGPDVGCDEDTINGFEVTGYGIYNVTKGGIINLPIKASDVNSIDVI